MGTRRKSRSSPTVLIVESDRSESTRLAAILRAEGYDAYVASTFHDAVRALQSVPARVLLTTVRLGPYNGLHLIVRTRITRPGIAAILTHHEADRMLCAEATTNDAAFLLKPCSRETLARAVATSLALRHNGGNVSDRDFSV